jgi:hypothetical protein
MKRDGNERGHVESASFGSVMVEDRRKCVKKGIGIVWRGLEPETKVYRMS